MLLTVRRSHNKSYIRVIKDKELCHTELFDRLVDQPLVSNLKYLVLSGPQLDEFDLNKLNKFSQLEHLEIESEVCWFKKEKVELNLKKLKALAFHRFNDRFPLSIDCPLLDLLLYVGEPENARLLEVKHPETIRKLITALFRPKLAPFKNVEILWIGRFETFRKDTLTLFPRLKEFRYFLGIEYALSKCEKRVGAISKIKRRLKEIAIHVQASKGCDFFQIRNCGLSSDL